jgi:CheY-specific phosphatase CheX
LIPWAAVRDQLHTSVHQVWTSYVGRELAAAEFDLLERHPSIVRGQMRIEGVLEGSLYVECSEQLARQVAIAMFNPDGESLTAADVYDAWAEITNIVGGGVKHALPAPIHLSLPCVEFLSRRDTTLSAGRLRTCIGFVSESEPLRVGILCVKEGQ